jgi:hypothetical protein
MDKEDILVPLMLGFTEDSFLIRFSVHTIAF